MWIEEAIDKDGNLKYKYVERYKDPLTDKTKRVCVTLDKNNAQMKKLAQETLQAKIEKKLLASVKKDMTFEELVEVYSAYQEKVCKASTCERNKRTLTVLCSLFGSDSIVDNMTAGYVNKKLLGTNKEPGTLNEYIKRLKAMLTWAYTNDYIINYEMIKKLKPYKDNKEKIADKYLEPEEIQKLLNSMVKCPRWYYLTEFLILTGMRIGEVIALKMSDIEEDVIHVTKTYDPINDIVTVPKTDCSVRDVFINNELKILIKKIKMYEKEDRLQHGISSNLLFCNRNGYYISYFSYNKYLREKCQALFGRRLTVHALRHTHASLLLAEGISIDTISRRLGHKNSKVTREIYVHVMKKIEEQDRNNLRYIKLIG